MFFDAGKIEPFRSDTFERFFVFERPYNHFKKFTIFRGNQPE